MEPEYLKTKILGRKYLYFECIDSTQKEIKRLINNNNIINGTLIQADVQSNGIGTHGRQWYTDEPNNIAFSIYIEVECKIQDLNGITLNIAEIIVSIFKNKYDICLEIKEPNDIVYKGKKIGGILTETKTLLGITKYLIVGIGINTNEVYFCNEIKNTASSIKLEFGKDIDNKDIIIEFCNLFEYEILKRTGKII